MKAAYNELARFLFHLGNDPKNGANNPRKLADLRLNLTIYSKRFIDWSW